MISVKTVGPNIALIVSKGRKREIDVRIGGRVVYIPLLHRVDTLSLELRTIEVSSVRTTTKPGVHINLTGVCQVKVAGYKETESGVLEKDINAVRLAAQHFIGKTKREIEESISKTLEGHQRAIIGCLTPEELYREREMLSSRVKELAISDMRAMGLEIVSYTISSITDDQGYFDALGLERAERIKAEATVGAAKHSNDAKKKAYEEGVKATLFIDQQKTREAQSNKDQQLFSIRARQETIEAQVIQEKAKKIRDAAELQKLVKAENLAEEARINGQSDIERAQIKKKKLLLEHTIVAPAEANANAKVKDAEAITCIAKARAEEIRLQEEARSEAARWNAKVATDKLHDQASAWEKFGQGALGFHAIEALPKIAEGIARPLSKTEKMVFIGGGKGGGGTVSTFASDIMTMMAEVPEVVKTLTGVDLNQALQTFLGDKKNGPSVPPANQGSKQYTPRVRASQPAGSSVSNSAPRA